MGGGSCQVGCMRIVARLGAHLVMGGARWDACCLLARSRSVLENPRQYEEFDNCCIFGMIHRHPVQDAIT